MAHGFLAYEPVSGESPLVNFAKKKLKEGLKSLWGKFQKTSGSLVKSSGGQVQYDANPQGVTVKDVTRPEPPAKRMLSGSTAAALGAGIGSISRQEPTVVPGGTGGGIAKKPGGTFTELPGVTAASGGLNAETFFKQATTGVGPSGEYLTNAQRREAFIKSRQESVKTAETSASGPPISPDSGIDIVAAVNRNTQMIVSLVEAVKAQTKNDSNLVEKQIQGQETLMLRAAARDEEASLEQGSDLSGFMTPENFAKRKKNEEKKETGSKLKEFFRGPNPFKKDEGCGCSPIMPGPGGRGPIIGGPPGGGGLPIPDYVDQWRDMNRRPGSRLGGGASVTRRGGGARAVTRAATKIGGKGVGKAVGKGLAKKIPGVGVLAGGAFAAERAMKGDWLGAGGELLSGVASIIPGLGTAVSTGIDAGLAARDAGLTPFANGGIVTSPVAGLVGEAGNEGIFPLEGKRGEKTFRMFGEGIFQAQKDNDTDFAKLQSMGLKQYYEREGGFKKMGEGLKDFFAGLGGAFANIFNSLTGGAANAAEFNPADYLGGGDFAGGGQDMMTLATIAALESGSAQGQADVAQSVYNRLADKTYGKSITDILTRQGQYQVAFKDPTASSGAGTQVADVFKNIRTEDDAVKAMMYYYNKRGMKITAEQARQKLRGSVAAIQNTELQKKAAKHVGGRTEFLSAGSNVPGAAWRGSGSDNKFFAAYGSGKQMARGASAAPTGLFAPAGGGGGGGNASIAAAAQSLKGMDTSGGPGGGSVSCVYAVNKVFSKAGVKPPWGGAQSTDAVINAARKAGWQQVGFGDARPGDLWAYDANDGRSGHVGIMMPNGKVLSNSTSQKKFVWEADKGQLLNAYPKNGMTPPGGVFFRPPGGNSGGSVARPPGGGGGGTPAARVNRGGQRGGGSSPGSLQASAADPNTGVAIGVTSQQVAMASMGGGAAPTIINNYYTSAGGSGGGVNPNGVSPGIGMEQTGTAIFQDLRIRALA